MRHTNRADSPFISRRWLTSTRRRRPPACCRRLGRESLEFRFVLATFVVTTGADSGSGSLREAVQLANDNAGLDIIQFDSAIPDLTINLSTTELAVTDSLVVDASDLPQRLDIDTAAADPTPAINDGNGIRAFNIDDDNLAVSSFVEFRNVRFLGGDVTGQGGAIRSEESLVLNDVVFSDNHATVAGGAVHQTTGVGGTFVLQDSTVTGNTSVNGGALLLQHSSGSIASVTNTYFGDNHADQNGGAIWAYTAGESYLGIYDPTVTGNSAGNRGGGLYLKTTNASTLVDTPMISGNTAGGAGGGIFSHTTLSGSLELRQIFFLSNHAGGQGGGWYGVAANDSQTTVTDGSFFTNYAASDGGAISVVGQSGASTDVFNIAMEGNDAVGSGGGLSSVARDNAQFALQQSVIGNNTAGPTGGGIRLHSETGGVNDVVGTPLTNNYAVRGGGIFAYAEENGIARVSDTLAHFNSAFAGGGGMYALASTGGTISFEGVTANQNETLEEIGGGIAARVVQDGHVNIYDATTSDNTARFGGGIALFLNQGTAYLETATITNNSSYGSGGGLAVQAFGNTVASISQVTAANNEATSNGGGIWAVATTGTIDIVNSTVSGNTAVNSGGGIYASPSPQQPNNIALRHLTISDNAARDNALTPGEGGGLAGSSFSQPVLSHSIIANNQVLGVPGDISGNFVADYNLVEVPETVTLTGPGNVTEVDPQLLPLADNGGPTLTHSFAETSPALDSGDPAFTGPPMFDQRGAPFARVLSGRVDRGALELVRTVDGDFDDDGDHDLDDIDALVAEIVAGTNDLRFDLTRDGLVDLADRDAWLAEAGEINLGTGRAYLLGDANLDAVVDGLDFIVWNENKFLSGGLWSGADFDADGFTDGQDFIVWNANKFAAAGSHHSGFHHGDTEDTEEEDGRFKDEGGRCEWVSGPKGSQDPQDPRGHRT